MEKTYRFVTILSIIGLMLGLYLISQQFQNPLTTPCSISETINCDAVISGPVSKTLGIPTPLIGIVGYALILFGSIKKLPKLMLGMTTFGLAFCGWLGYVELFQLHVICPVCIGCQVIMLSVFLASVNIYRSREK